MEAAKRKKLEQAGWQVGSAQEFLERGSEEAAFVEPKLALSQSLKEWRTAQGLSHVRCA